MSRLEVTTDGGELAVRIDGQPVEDLEGLDLRVHRGEKVMATLTLSPDEVDVDTDAFMWIKAQVRESQGG